MSNLNDINFKYNAITDFGIHHFANSALVRIQLSSNPLTIREMVIPLSLEKLFMKYTDVQTLTIRCVSSGGCAITHLQLMSNMLESPIIGEIKPTIEYYTLIGNPVGIPGESLAEEAFTDMSNLIYLNLANHNFDLYTAFVQLTTIKILIFESLLITDNSALFGEDGLVAQTGIFELSLANNLLTQLPNITTLPLRFLKLQYNSISVIDRDILAAMRWIQEIQLQGNPIINIAVFPYQLLPTIYIINIRYIY